MTDLRKIVLCMKWGSKYSAQDVNRLYRRVKVNIEIPFRFCCMTEDSRGIDSEIDVFPLPKLELPNDIERGWKKLLLFESPLFDLSGTILFLDLDVEIVDSIDELFHYSGDFCMIRDWRKGQYGIGNSSVFRFEANKYSHILANYRIEPDLVAKKFRNEQEFISSQVSNIQFWPSQWCVSYKYHCIPKFPMNLISAPRVPAGSKIIAFHGHPKVDEARRGYWTPRLNRIARKATWIS